MDRLKLSAEVFAKELAPYIAFKNFSSMRGTFIDHFEVYDSQTFLMRKDCLCLCLGDEFPPCQHIQGGTTFICTSAKAACKNTECNRCNIIALKDLGPAAAINAVAAVFARYQEYGLAIELAASKGDEGLQAIMDIGEKMIGAPLCLLDINYNVIACSDHKELFRNPLWETIVEENKPARCEIIDTCIRSIAPDNPAPTNSAMKAAAVSGYNLLLRSLLRRGHAVASLWAISTEKGFFFPPASLHMLAWIGRCLDEWAEGTQQLITGRGSIMERFLLDIADGSLHDDMTLGIAANYVGFEIKSDAEYQLCVFKPIDKVSAAEIDIQLMQTIEKRFPKAICAVTDMGVLVLFTLEANGIDLEPKEKEVLQSLCSQLSYTAVLSTSYFNLTDTPKIVQQIADCLSFLALGTGRGKLHHHCNHLVQQNMRFVLANQPPETLIHPMIRKLQKYDEENGVNYLETFKVYLNNRCNAAETSEQLYMHRNTLLHRIKRIEELLGHTLEDWTLRRVLLFSIDYLYLEEKRDI